MVNSADPDQLASTDLDLHCLQKQGISGFSRTRVKMNIDCMKRKCASVVVRKTVNKIVLHKRTAYIRGLYKENTCKLNRLGCCAG